MNVKQFLKNSILTKGIYAWLKSIKLKRELDNKFDYHGSFVNKSHGSDYLCIVLAGYKEYLYLPVFSRLKKYAMEGMDICIISSGKYSEELLKMCEANDWSYLSTKENNVSLVQNVAIKLHDKAKFIFKLDEDIFVTDGFFKGLLDAYRHAEEGTFIPGVIAPIIPINGYGHVRVLEKLGLESEYESRFGPMKCAAGGDRPIENSTDVARFFWGEDGIIPSIDEMNSVFSKEPIEERAVPIRFSIGAILFTRSLWEDMNYFSVNRSINSLGRDEIDMCTYCTLHSRPILVSENVVVGHFSFGPQNMAMKDYYDANKDKFAF